MTSVRLDTSDGVAVITLDDPGRRNALTSDLVRGIVDAFDRAELDPAVGAVVLTGTPPAFCAGADLGDLASATPEALRGIYEAFLRTSRSSLPTIAAVNGPAVGAGMNLALACDVRVAARSARFESRFLRLGIHPGGGHTWMLHRLLGPQGTAALVLFGDVLDGEAAERCGLVWKCVADESLLDEAGALAARAATLPRELAAKAKDTLRRIGDAPTHDDAVEVEVPPQLWSFQQPWFQERIAAMRQRIKSS